MHSRRIPTYTRARNNFLITDVNANETRFAIDKDGNIGIGTTEPGQPLTVAGVIQSTVGGIKFPDESVQTTAWLDAAEPAKPLIRSVMAWLKNYENTPALPDSWIAAKGQALLDPESPYHEQNLPNLNGTNAGTRRFLRGSNSSGSTGGTETHSHNIGFPAETSAGFGTDVHGHPGITETSSTLPSYYEVVWIIRVK